MRIRSRIRGTRGEALTTKLQQKLQNKNVQAMARADAGIVHLRRKMPVHSR